MSYYQNNYSEIYSHELGAEHERINKAKMTLLILRDFFEGVNLKSFKLLEIGCFSGEISNYLAPYFKEYVAIDIDENSLKIAESKRESENLEFRYMNAENLVFEDNTFDIILNSHIYEHVPNPAIMMNEVLRTLKPGGVCYFAADNKFKLVEPHYRLPLLSWMPKSLGHFYLKITGKGRFYYETHFTYPALKELVNRFEITDYTNKIIKFPKNYNAHGMIKDGSFQQKGALFIYKYFQYLFPSFIWILTKTANEN